MQGLARDLQGGEFGHVTWQRADAVNGHFTSSFRAYLAQPAHHATQTSAAVASAMRYSTLPQLPAALTARCRRAKVGRTASIAALVALHPARARPPRLPILELVHLPW